MRKFSAFALVACALLFLCGCEEKKPKTNSYKADFDALSIKKAESITKKILVNNTLFCDGYKNISDVKTVKFSKRGETGILLTITFEATNSANNKRYRLQRGVWLKKDRDGYFLDMADDMGGILR